MLEDSEMHGGVNMKYTLKKNIITPIEGFAEWEIQRLTLEGAELSVILKIHLTNVMEGILDPDISGKKPDKFIDNFQCGRLGDFSNRYIIIAKDNSKVIGLLIALPEEEQKLHIYSMGVSIAYRTMGVASALLSKCVNDMVGNNMKEILLDVHSDNLPALNLYKKFGFR